MAICPCCEKETKHGPFNCPSKKGCARCGRPRSHKTDQCKETSGYPPFNKQRCGSCFEEGHEAQDCKETMAKTCALCGHLGHSSKKSTCVVTGKVDLAKLQGEPLHKVINQFTPKSRQKYLDTKADVALASGPSVTLPVRSSGSPSNSQLGSLDGTKVDNGGASNAVSSSKKQLWKQAESKLPPRKAAEEQTGTKISSNFFKIKLLTTNDTDGNDQISKKKAGKKPVKSIAGSDGKMKVDLCRYSITLGNIFTPKSSKTVNPNGKAPGSPSSSSKNDPGPSHSSPSNSPNNGDRKIKPETKRYMITQIIKELNCHENWATDYDSMIISAGPLTDDHTVDQVDHVMTVEHQRTGRQAGSTVPVVSTIRYLGLVATEQLVKHVKSSTTVLETPENDLRALNIISWKLINDNLGFTGGRVDNKFFPASLDASKGKLYKDDLYRIRHGFSSSMRPGDGSILLNVHTATCIFFASMNLKEWIDKCWPKTVQIDQDTFKSKLKNVQVVLKGLHDEDRRRAFQICNVSRLPVSQQTFTDDEGKEKTVHKYMHETYKSKYTAPGTSRCINVGTKKNTVWFPDHELTIVDWQMAKKKLPDNLTKDMVLVAEKRPQFSKNAILGHALDALGIEPLQGFYQNFGIVPSPSLVDVMAPKLATPTLNFRGNTPAIVNNGGWNFETCPGFIQSAFGVEKMHVISLAGPLTQAFKEDFKISVQGGFEKQKFTPEQGIRALCRALKKYKMTPKDLFAGYLHCEVDPDFPEPKKEPPAAVNTGSSARADEASALDPEGKGKGKEVARDSSSADSKRKGKEIQAQEPISPLSYRELCSHHLNAALKELSKGNTTNYKPLIIILPNTDSYLYAEVKRWSDCQAGIPTICITKEKLCKAAFDDSTCANICVKINFKLKGINHELNISGGKGGFGGAKGRTMVMGADVTHPQKGSGCPSMAGVVATNDDSSSRYLASARLQTGREEYIEDLSGMVKERVIAWAKFNCGTFKQRLIGLARLPLQILFYRDGVSESQFGMVRHEELDQIAQGCQDALASLKKGQQPIIENKNLKWVPKITLLVVVKRHHTRFYPKETMLGEPGGKQDINLLSGTLVDTEVVTPNHFSFYLQSHGSGLGTARSALYVVIEDGVGYTAKDLQKITYNLCFTGARATKAISVCTPARYADILCERLRCYLRPFIDGGYDNEEGTLSPVESNGDIIYAADPKLFVADTNLWKPEATAWPDVAESVKVTRTSPWHPNLDDVMFYL